MPRLPHAPVRRDHAAAGVLPNRRPDSRRRPRRQRRIGEPQVTPTASRDGRSTDATGQASGHLARPGAVAGAVLRGARLSAGISEAALATASGVTEDAIRSWEDGTSPLASVPIPQVERLEAALSASGADLRLIADLGAAPWCDLVILAITGNRYDEDAICLLADPVASSDAFSELLAWCLAGRVPERHRLYAATRGPLLADSILIERATRALDAIHPRLSAACRLAL
jgi:transcriptional regulator with XRE-family HTH domain